MERFKCPFCGEEIPEYSKICTRCKTSLKDFENCKQCGEFIPKGSKVCPYCGYKKSSKAKIVIIVVLVVALLGGGIFFLINQSKKTAYQENYNQAVGKLVGNAVNTETFLNTLNKVWTNSIYKTSSDETDKYTKDENGNFYEDFNDAISKLYADNEVLTVLKEMETTHLEIEELIRELNNVPSGFENAHTALMELYTSYSDFYQLIYTNNSLNSLNEKFQTLDEKILSEINVVKTYIKQP